MTRNFIKKIGNIYIDIYVIGYPSEGESQIIIIREDEDVIYSFVIDCFIYKNSNKTIDILKNLHITELDCLIWTHPDLDHSIGIDDIVNYFCGKKTCVFIPEGVYGNESDFINYNPKVKNIYKLIQNKLNRNRVYNVETATATQHGQNSIFKKSMIDETGAELILDLISIAPISSLIRRKWSNSVIKKKNDVSIALLLKVGSISLFLGGDIENPTIKALPKYVFDNLNYIKTPHHTSNSSSLMIDRIVENIDLDNPKIPVATSTIFSRFGLPTEELIEHYKQYVSYFYCTGTGKSDFGYIKTSFQVQNLSYSNILQGNAKQV